MTEDRALWARILQVDSVSHEYAAQRQEWPGAAVFTSDAGDHFNLAVLQPHAPPDPDALLDRLVAHFRAVGGTPRVRVTPLSAPPGWPDRLRARGWVETDEREVFMHLVGPLRAARNPTVEVRAATDAAGLRDVVTVQSAGFGGGAPSEASLAGAQRNLARWDYRYLLATLDGVPVGAASARFQDGAVGIYGVATLERFRGRGVSTAILHAIVDEAQQRGCDLVFLSAMPGSYAEGFYTRLGFTPLFTIQTFELPYHKA